MSNDTARRELLSGAGVRDVDGVLDAANAGAWERVEAALTEAGAGPGRTRAILNALRDDTPASTPKAPPPEGIPKQGPPPAGVWNEKPDSARTDGLAAVAKEATTALVQPSRVSSGGKRRRSEQRAAHVFGTGETARELAGDWNATNRSAAVYGRLVSSSGTSLAIQIEDPVLYGAGGLLHHDELKLLDSVLYGVIREHKGATRADGKWTLVPRDLATALDLDQRTILKRLSSLADVCRVDADGHTTERLIVTNRMNAGRGWRVVMERRPFAARGSRARVVRGSVSKRVLDEVKRFRAVLPAHLAAVLLAAPGPVYRLCRHLVALSRIRRDHELVEDINDVVRWSGLCAIDVERTLPLLVPLGFKSELRPDGTYRFHVPPLALPPRRVLLPKHPARSPDQLT